MALVLVACGSQSFPLAARVSTTSTTPRATTSNPMTAPTSGVATAEATATSVTASTASTSASAATTPSSTTSAAPVTTNAPAGALAAPQLARAGTAGQAIVVSAADYGASAATLTAYDRTADGWRRAYGPYTARVGYNGFAPPNEKREGDGRTPSGVYGFDFFFGVNANPGVAFPYRQVTQSIVWVDDPNSPLYNQWVNRDQQDPGQDPESMYQPIAYQHGAVIAYNAARTAGLGSAIFLHASVGGATAGCVSVPVGQLLELLRWLDPAKSPRIIMGVG